MTNPPPAQPIEIFYGRRKGKKLRLNRSRLVETLLPSVQLELADAAALVSGLGAAGYKDLWFEVGFGTGEHLAWQAKTFPDVLMVGCEPFINGVSKLLEFIEADDLKNIRIYPNDARKLMDVLPDSCLGRVFVLFNDPWPKKRHWERRFISPVNLDRLARLMKPGAELRLATDDKSLLDWMLLHTRAHPAFGWRVESCHDWQTRPADWPPTRYEQKAIRGEPYFLTFIRQ